MGAYLFLDFDGVITHPGHTRDGLWWPDPRKVRMLNRIVDRTGATVVVSSTWRLHHPLQELAAILEEAGFTGELAGVTPASTKLGHGRGYQIQAWLDEHAPKDARIAILDDDADMAHLMPFLVQTKTNTGMVPADVEHAVRLLNEAVAHPARGVGPGDAAELRKRRGTAPRGSGTSGSENPEREEVMAYRSYGPDYFDDEEFTGEPGFADPGGNSALRAETLARQMEVER